MPAKVTYFSTAIAIGGHSISLVSDGLPDVADPVQALKEKIKEGIAFKMDPGQVVSVNIGQIVDWVGRIGTDFNVDFLKKMVSGKPKALDDVIVNLWNLSINTKGHLSFNIQVAFDENFYDELGVPEIVQKIFTIDSMGIGISYDAAKSADTDNTG